MIKTIIKTITAFAALLSAVLLAGCGNMSMGFGHFEFDTVHVSDFAGHTKDFKISKWYESDNGIEIKTTDGTSIWLSEGTYILFEDKCPICCPEGLYAEE